MIATSGRLMTGVVAMPPSGPSDVMVSVEPDSSSDFALPVRAASASRVISRAKLPDILGLRVADDGHHQPRIGLRRHAEMHRAVARHHARFIIIARIDHREIGQRLADRDDHQRQHGQLGPVCRDWRSDRRAYPPAR